MKSSDRDLDVALYLQQRGGLDPYQLAAGLALPVTKVVESLHELERLGAVRIARTVNDTDVYELASTAPLVPLAIGERVIATTADGDQPGVVVRLTELWPLSLKAAVIRLASGEMVVPLTSLTRRPRADTDQQPHNA